MVRQRQLERDEAKDADRESERDPNGSDDRDANSYPPGTDLPCRPSDSPPSEALLTSGLERLRAERRRGMSHANRIHVEALSKERVLDLCGMRSLVAGVDLTDADENGPEGGQDHSMMDMDDEVEFEVALHRLETECTASFMVDWLSAIEFSYAQGLRAPDPRWTALCARLNQEMARLYATLEKCRNTAAAGRPRSRKPAKDRFEAGVRGVRDVEAVLSGEGRRIRDVLEAFEHEAGNVVDERHETADAVYLEVEAEAPERIKAWAEAACGAAADLCSAERRSYLRQAGALRALSPFLDPSGASPSEYDRVRSVALKAGDALASELSALRNNRELRDGGEALESQVLRAIAEGVAPPGGGRWTDVGGTRGRSGADSSSTTGASAIGPPGVASDSVQTCSGEGDWTSHPRDANAPCGERASCGVDPTRGNNLCSGPEVEGALAIALWKCRHRYRCRVRSVVARLARALEQCEISTSRTLSRLKRFKRRRVELEHAAVCSAVSNLRHSLASCDDTEFGRVARAGIQVSPACAIPAGSTHEDFETPWGPARFKQRRLGSE